MRILVYGAGVIGSLYAARLQHAGHRVTVLARASRLKHMQQNGLLIEDLLTASRSEIRVDVTDQLAPDDFYDLAIVTVTYNQLSAILPNLAANTAIPLFLFMLNNPLGSARLTQALSPARVLLGFPGAGGTLENGVVHFALIPQQPTTLGIPATGHATDLHPLRDTFRAAGFPTRIDSNMDAWLSCHAFFVTSISGAIYLAGGSCPQLSRNQPLVQQMVDGVREGFRAVRALSQPVHPFALKVLFTWMPRLFAVHYWCRYLAAPNADYIFARHARHASAEMAALAHECRLLLLNSRISAPALDHLYRAIDAYAAANPSIPVSH